MPDTGRTQTTTRAVRHDVFAVAIVVDDVAGFELLEHGLDGAFSESPLLELAAQVRGGEIPSGQVRDGVHVRALGIGGLLGIELLFAARAPHGYGLARE